MAERDRTSGARGADATFRTRLISEIPNLRAFAVSLSGSVQLADDLVQDALLKAWTHADSFAEGTNMRAWLFTILRNSYFSIRRKRGREVQDATGAYAERVGTAPTQDGVVDLADFRRALAKLSPEQREVLIMVGVSGISYEEAAEVCGVAVGTVKSRVNRARAKLVELLGIDDVGEFGPDRTSLSIMRASQGASLP